MSELVRKRNLPHIDVNDKPYFVTACLRGSISAVGLKKIRAYREHLQKEQMVPGQSESERKLNLEKLVFKFVDDLLDNNPPTTHLKNERLARILQDAFFHFANDRYHLLAFVIMPSHHHWLFQPREDWIESIAVDHKKQRRSPREIISHSIQGFTAKQCNKILGTTGPFWQQETWDHFSRNDEETLRIIEYIEQNPVVAKLADTAKEYRWSSASIRLERGIERGSPIPPV